ncbi:metallophosphoesterase [Vibrio sp. S4M6]|uniref:metallophosphoesterase n=1 Tax=Vibrio sinus TaxID=2946865 RepID=UPI00202A5F2C|nr:metallophosphoesterase [Vibrio sinus]MCL9781784.1 metallophosphoesterase [Vibrio sinus]
MRLFAVSDLHLDYEENRNWLAGLSNADFQSDILILAGDISDDTKLIQWCFTTLQSKFRQVFFVPGNHDLWVRRNPEMTSLEKFELLQKLAAEHQISMQTYHFGSLSVVPLLGWYDYTFGSPSEKLQQSWTDFYACSWPKDMQAEDITRYFLSHNQHQLPVQNEVVISFSHFLPRIDLIPSAVPAQFHYLFPVLGSSELDKQIRTIQASKHLHVYGHSHLNRSIQLDNVEYINNAFGYPSETHIARKQLVQIYET